MSRKVASGKHRTRVPWILAALIVVGLSLTLGTVSLGAVPAAPGATCTAAQKAAHQKALAAYQKRMLRDRKAYYKTHNGKKQRATFVKRQQAKLAALRTATGCTLATPALPPPSSGPACAPSLSSSSAPYPYNEGTDTNPDFARSTGNVRAVMLFVDTADRPDTVDPAPYYEGSAANLNTYYRDVSYGRLSLTVTSPAKWFRLPKLAAAYSDSPFDEGRYEALLRDAVATADPEVDFSGVDIVYLVATPLTGTGRGGAYFGDSPVVADGTELRDSAQFKSPIAIDVLLHETGHVLGLPHVTAGFWDIMDQPHDRGPFLGWPRYKLHWIDPDQIRCLSGQGTLEDTLAPINGPGGIKLLVAPTSASTAVVAEFKQGEGGVLVTAVDASQSDAPGLIVQTHGTGYSGAALGPGEELTVGQVTVTMLATSSTAARVRMTWR